MSAPQFGPERAEWAAAVADYVRACVSLGYTQVRLRLAVRRLRDLSPAVIRVRTSILLDND